LNRQDDLLEFHQCLNIALELGLERCFSALSSIQLSDVASSFDDRRDMVQLVRLKLIHIMMESSLALGMQ